MSYILLREAYIANTRKLMIQVEPRVILTGATASFKFTYNLGNE